ncbi:MAG: type III pantothenate kinase [Bacteroidales bacterium]|nr:type III pantothenate kinase [Bacteroidales bacterium]
MTKLVLDIGNSFQKAAIFSNNDMVYFESAENIYVSLESLFCKFHPASAIIASVVEKNKALINLLNSKCPTLICNGQIPTPLTNKYLTPETLGGDRLAAAVAGNQMFPAKNLLVVDAGTCIKYDFVRADATYLGGSIAPGIEMRFNALHTFTGKLPLVERTENTPLTGKNTTQSILSGVLNGTVAEVDGIIYKYNEQYSDIKVVLTGGDADYLAGKLKSKIFAIPNMVLIGLKIILDYNDKEK